jgi:hypothetical protein
MGKAGFQRTAEIPHRSQRYSFALLAFNPSDYWCATINELQTVYQGDVVKITQSLERFKDKIYLDSLPAEMAQKQLYFSS